MKVLIVKVNQVVEATYSEEDTYENQKVWLVPNDLDSQELKREYKMWKKRTNGSFYSFMSSKDFTLAEFDEFII